MGDYYLIEALTRYERVAAGPAVLALPVPAQLVEEVVHDVQLPAAGHLVVDELAQRELPRSTR